MNKIHYTIFKTNKSFYIITIIFHNAIFLNAALVIKINIFLFVNRVMDWVYENCVLCSVFLSCFLREITDYGEFLSKLIIIFQCVADLFTNLLSLHWRQNGRKWLYLLTAPDNIAVYTRFLRPGWSNYSKLLIH